MDSATLITLSLITVFLTIGLLFYYFISQKKQQNQKILNIIRGTKTPLKNEGDIQNDRRMALAQKLQTQNEGKGRRKSVLRDQLNYAGFYNTSLKNFFMASLISCFLMAAFGLLFKFNIWVIFFMAVIGFFGLPKLFLKFKTARRQKKFLEDFADALESMVRLLKAGMPVGEAIAMVAREFEGPVSEEMTKIYEEQKIGVPMGEACLNAARRMPLTEVQMFATGIQIQQQTGSSLSEILLNLAKVIRARFRLKRKIQALSAEAKASAAIIGSLPILVGAGLTAVNPEYMEPLFNTLKGKIYLTGAGLWMLMGILIMRQMINFRI